MMEITKSTFMAGCRVLIDNDIDPDEVQVVMQALCYVMFDTETEQFMEDIVCCCQSCKRLDNGCKGNYENCTIHEDCKHFEAKDGLIL